MAPGLHGNLLTTEAMTDAADRDHEESEEGGREPMTLRARVVAFLVSEGGRAMCYACIAGALNVRVHASRAAVLFLGPGAFQRRVGACDACRADRLVIAHMNRGAAGA